MTNAAEIADFVPENIPGSPSEGRRSYCSTASTCTGINPDDTIGFRGGSDLKFKGKRFRKCYCPPSLYIQSCVRRFLLGLSSAWVTGQHWGGNLPTYKNLFTQLCTVARAYIRVITMNGCALTVSSVSHFSAGNLPFSTSVLSEV